MCGLRRCLGFVVLLASGAMPGLPANASTPDAANGLDRVSRPAAPVQGVPPAHLTAASRVRFDEPAAGVTLHGGDTIEIRWHGVPASAEETELLLSVDGGRHFSLRLTEELDADSGWFLWRVPSLNTERATLALRMGIDEHEILSPAGPVFRIVPDTTSGRVALRWRGGEIWQGPQDGLPEDGDAAPGPIFGGEPERIARLSEASFGFVLPRASSMRLAFASRPRPEIFVSSATAGPRVSSRVPATFPRRV